jgi:hypothetical protein
MKNKLCYALLALLCINFNVICMGPAGSAEVLAELMATLAKRKQQKRITKGVISRRSAIVESSDSESDTDVVNADAISAASHIRMPSPPPAPPAATDTTQRVKQLPVPPQRQASVASKDSSSSSSDDSSSSDEDGFASDLSDMEDAHPADVDQLPYSVGMFGHTLTTVEGLIAHLQTRLDTENPLEPRYQHSVSQHFDNALLAATQHLTGLIRTQTDQADIAIGLSGLAEMKACVTQMNQLKSLAEYHNLIASTVQVEKAEQAAKAYKQHIATMKSVAMQAIEAHDTSLSAQWGAARVLERAKRLKREKVGLPVNAAALDALTQETAMALRLATEDDTYIDPIATVQQAKELIRILKGKKVPLNPYSVNELLNALLALEAKIAQQDESTTERSLVERYTIERVVEKLSAYVVKEAAERTQSLGAGAADTDTCPVPDVRDDRTDII